jgi:hypothetical protein
LESVPLNDPFFHLAAWLKHYDSPFWHGDLFSCRRISSCFRLAFFDFKDADIGERGLQELLDQYEGYVREFDLEIVWQ